jgi:hypothetical protein
MKARGSTGAFVAGALAVLLSAGAAAAKPGRHHAGRKPGRAAAGKHAPAPSPAPSGRSGPAAIASSDGEAADAQAEGDSKPGANVKIKTKTYTFGAMDVEGKLKTPQLLYFLNRVKLELDMSAPDKRSFMKELAQSADDKSL